MTSNRRKNMRGIYRSVVCLMMLCPGLFGQTTTAAFQFPGAVKPGDSPTITGTDLAGITAVTLRSAGKPDVPANGVHATATSVTFTVPSIPSGNYTVSLSPGTITPIPLTVTAPAEATPPAAIEPSAKIYMPDGQLESHSIRVYMTRDIALSQNPKLRLLRSHAVTKRAVAEARSWEPGVVAPGQEWMELVEGQQVRRSGTLLLFDLSPIDFEFKPMLRVMPVVSWTEGSVERIAVGSREVNVGEIVAAAAWTVLVVGFAVMAVIVMSWRAGGNPLLLLAGVDGHLSLAQTQIACWTVAVAGIVLGYGLIRLDIPNIPASLLALMGASLATGGIAFFQDSQKQQAAADAGVAPVRRTLALGDLIRVFPAGQPPELSLAKAQMLFWTVLLLVLFISKSILDGAIWEVPWALVALMGFSQAGYLAPKLAPQP
jgi:hypothetical protein